MGKYNFSAMKFDEIMKRLEALEEANNNLRKENARLRNQVPSKRSLLKDINNSDKAIELLSVDVKDGQVIHSEARMDARFKTLYQNIFKLILPVCYIDPRTRDNRLQYKFFDELTDDEYRVYVETFEAVIDTLYYAKQKLMKGGTENE